MEKKITRLPFELRNYIYNYVDYDTKICVSLDAHKDLINKRDLFGVFTIQQLQNLYKHCVMDRISIYHKNTRKRTIKKEIFALFPKPIQHNYIDEYGEEQNVYQQHPLIDVLEKFKTTTVFDKKTKGAMLIKAIHGFSNISSGNIDIDYVFRAIAYNIIHSILYYKRIVDQKRQRAEEKRIIRANMKAQQMLLMEEEREIIRRHKQEEREEKELSKLVDKEKRNRIRREFIDQKLSDKLQMRERVLQEKLAKMTEKRKQAFQKSKKKLEKAFAKRNQKKVIVIPYTIRIIVK